MQSLSVQHPQALVLPAIGTVVEIEQADIGLPSSSRMHMARVMFDEKENRWKISSRLDQSLRWVPLQPGNRIGLRVFVNDVPDYFDRYLVVTSIHHSGRAVYADLRSNLDGL